MEKRMEECTREIMKDPSVRGVVCTDPNGALFCGTGTLEGAHCSAVVSQLANLAAALEPNAQPLAIVLSSSGPGSSVALAPAASVTLQNPAVDQQQQQKVLIKTNGVLTVAVHK